MIGNGSLLAKLDSMEDASRAHSFRSEVFSEPIRTRARVAIVFISIIAVMWPVIGSLPGESSAAPQLQQINSSMKFPRRPGISNITMGNVKDFDPVPIETLNPITMQLLSSRFPQNDYVVVKRATFGLALPLEEHILASGVDTIQVEGRYCHKGFCLTLVLDLVRNVIAAEFFAAPKGILAIISTCVTGELIYPHQQGSLEPLMGKGDFHSRDGLSPVLVCYSKAGPRVLTGENVGHDPYWNP